MKILIHQFLGNNHSWSLVGQNIARALIKQGKKVDLFSTNGYNFFPDDLKQFIIDKPADIYDCQISYTAMKNFPTHLKYGNKNRFGIWCYEFASKNALPTGFAKFHSYCDMVLPPSQFAKQVFADSGVPEDKMQVIPHGVDFIQLDEAVPFKLKTKKSTTIGMIIGQVHRRKNLPDMLEMFGKAFTNKDDVCLVIKVQDRDPQQPFELSFKNIISYFKNKYPNHAEIEVIKDFIPNIFSIYKACDIMFYATNCEGFGLISLEALACGKINITSNYGGVLDFCNSDNSLLINGKSFIVPSNYLYWSQKHNTTAFAPDIDDGVEKLKFAVQNKEMLLKRASDHSKLIRSKYHWDSVAGQILQLVKNA